MKKKKNLAKKPTKKPSNEKKVAKKVAKQVQKPAASSSFNAADYPHLSAFLRSYLHEDFKEEHGSAPGAMDEFCYHAHKRERDALKSEFDAFLNLAERRPFAQVRQWLTEGLGSAWLPPDKNALLALQTVLNQADNQKKR